MSEINCSACSELRENAADFLANGVTAEICESLENNTGLNPHLTVLHEDCEDLHNANDCLIGMLPEQVDAYDVCDWKDLAKKTLGNLYDMLKAMICTICGLWMKLEVVSYQGLLKLYTEERKVYSGTVTTNGQQAVAFTKSHRDGNMPSSVLTVGSGYKSVVVRNTLDYPILVNATFNCSISTEQNFACCYICVTRDGNTIGQTPFIAPNTYDQQCTAEPFILQPGQSATLGYYFAVGLKNEQWFLSEFGMATGGTPSQANTRCALDPYSTANFIQGSYFIVQAQTYIE